MSRILIVEDDRDIVGMLTTFLTSKGHEVATASSGAQAVKHLSEKPVDTVLLDLMLTDGLGTRVERFIRRHSGLYDTVGIIYQTVVGQPEELRMLQKLKPDAIITKPFTSDVLLRVLQETDMKFCVSENGRRRYSAPSELFEREVAFRVLRRENCGFALFRLTTYPSDDKFEKILRRAVQETQATESRVFRLSTELFAVVHVDIEWQKFWRVVSECAAMRGEPIEQKCVSIHRSFSDEDVDSLDVSQALSEMNHELRERIVDLREKTLTN